MTYSLSFTLLSIFPRYGQPQRVLCKHLYSVTVLNKALPSLSRKSLATLRVRFLVSACPLERLSAVRAASSPFATGILTISTHERGFFEEEEVAVTAASVSRPTGEVS